MNKTLKILIVSFISVIILGITIVGATIRTTNKTDDTDLRFTIEKDITDYLYNYSVTEEEVPTFNYLASQTSSAAAVSAVKHLTKASNDDVISTFESEVESAVKSANTNGGSRLSQDQLNIVTSGIEAICISDVHKMLSNQKSTTAEQLSSLQSSLESKIDDINATIASEKASYDNNISQLQSKLNSMNAADASKVVSLQNNVADIYSQIQTVKNSIDKNDTQIAAKVQELISEMESVDTDTAESLKKSLAKFGQTGDYATLEDALKDAIDVLVTRSIADAEKISKNKEDISTLSQTVSAQKTEIDRNMSALENTINQTVNEELDELQVKINNDIAPKIQAVQDDLNSKQDTLTGLVSQGEEDYAAYLTSIQQARQNAENNLDALTNGGVFVTYDDEGNEVSRDNVTGYVTDMANKQTAALTAITDKLGASDSTDSNTALGAINNKQTAATNALKDYIGATSADSSGKSGKMGEIEDYADSRMTEMTNIKNEFQESYDKIDQMESDLNDVKESIDTTISEQIEEVTNSQVKMKKLDGGVFFSGPFATP